ncbi:MAG TPA: galactose oxidase early set domain-containing protein, partial [Propionibacteriaceae bacterium]|nr:galactose oxidase early set domain-containing protein [Propionibacteriaceae bacterium]
GRVITAGSNPARKTEELRIEVFWPPYLFAGPRPTCDPSTTEVVYGDSLPAAVSTAEIASACLIRPGATTHSQDSEQRLVDLPIQVTDPGAVLLQMPTTATIAPPGWYLLYVVTATGIPSEGSWIHLTLNGA